MITGGALRGAAAGTRGGLGSGSFQEQPQVKSGNDVLDRPSFKGTIDPRRLR
jgi:hypothetical protein